MFSCGVFLYAFPSAEIRKQDKNKPLAFAGFFSLASEHYFLWYQRLVSSLRNDGTDIIENGCTFDFDKNKKEQEDRRQRSTKVK